MKINVLIISLICFIGFMSCGDTNSKITKKRQRIQDNAAYINNKMIVSQRNDSTELKDLVKEKVEDAVILHSNSFKVLKWSEFKDYGNDHYSIRVKYIDDYGEQDRTFFLSYVGMSAEFSVIGWEYAY